MTGTLSLSTVTQDQTKTTDNLGKILADDLVGDSDTQLVMAQQLDQFGRNMAALTQNAYEDLTVKINISINDIVAGS